MMRRRLKIPSLHRLGFGTTPGGASVEITLRIPRSQEEALHLALRGSPFRAINGASPVPHRSSEVLVTVHRQWSDHSGHPHTETTALREVSEILDRQGVRFAIFAVSLRLNDPYRWKHVYDEKDKREYWLALTSADQSSNDHLQHIANQSLQDQSSLKTRTALSWDYMSWSTRLFILLAIFAIVCFTIVILSTSDFLNGQQRSALQAALLLFLAFPGMQAISQSAAWKPALQQLAIAIPLVGALLYALTRIIYVEFYGFFGVSPEDVGLSYGTVLSQQFMFIAFKSALIVLVWLIVYGLLHESRKVSPIGTFNRFFVDTMTVFLFAMIVIAALIPDLINARKVAEHRRDHVSSEDSSLFLWPSLPRVLSQTSDGMLNGLPSAGGSNLIYLGSSTTVAHVYDGDRGLLLRLPEGSTPLVLVNYDRVVQLRSKRFQPSQLKLKQGEEFSILALNNDGTKHNFTVEGLDVATDIAPYDADGVARVRPLSVANFQLYCKYHKSNGMAGQVQVARQQ